MKIPFKVQYLIWAKKQPFKVYLSGTMVEEAIREYPEYFPEEAEYRRIYDSIPQEVKDAYVEDTMALWKKYDDLCPSKGFLYYSEHPVEYSEYQKLYFSYSEQRKKEDQEIWDKHFKPYNLKRND